MSLQDAVEVLRCLANAHPVENRFRLIAGALALSTTTYSCADRDLADSAIGLQLLATGGTLVLMKQDVAVQLSWLLLWMDCYCPV